MTHKQNVISLRVPGMGIIPVRVRVRLEARHPREEQAISRELDPATADFQLPGRIGCGRLDVAVRREANGVRAFRVSCQAEMRGGWILHEVALQFEVPWRHWRAVIPSLWGREIPDFPTDFRYEGNWPGWSACAQLLTLQGAAGGISVSARDSGMELKFLRMSRERRCGGCMVLGVVRVPEAVGTSGTWQVSGACDVLLQAFAGDWDTAAANYRREQEQVRPELRRRQPLHPLLRPDPIWLTYDCFAFPPHTRRDALRAIDALAAPVLFHLYNWTPYPFDTRYPDLPADRRGLAGDIAALRAAGAACIPYLNARLWDTTRKSWQEAGEAQAVRNFRGAIETERYAYSSDIDLGVICPVNAEYRGRVVKSCRDVVQRHRLRGVYLDQVGAAFGLRCYSAAHGHPPGGAQSWNAGQRALLLELRVALRREIGAAPLVTTENATEPLVDLHDGFLGFCGSPHEKLGRAIPLWQAIYGDFGQSFSENFGKNWRDERTGGPSDVMLRKLARQAIFGVALGWIAPQMATGEFAAAGALMRNARAARLPMLRTMREGLPIPSALDSVGDRTGVLQSAWQHDGRTVALAVNPVAVPAEFRWPDGKAGRLDAHGAMGRRI